MQTVKLDPIAYLLILAVLGVQLYATFLRGDDAARLIEQNDDAYQTAVFASSDNQGVMHQIFRQNEVDRELLKAMLVRCAR